MNSTGLAYYLTTLVVYGAVDVLACLGLSMEFGVAGITNFGFIIFQAAGAYTAAILSLPGADANGGFQSYIGGLSLPFPIPWIGAALVGGLIAVPFTLLVGRRLRGDFAAVGLLVTAVLANTLVTNYKPLFNGTAGLSLIPAPLGERFDATSTGYQWAYAAVAVVLAGLAYWVSRRVTESPYGRSLRAMRDNDVVADALGKNLSSMRLSMLVMGGAIAGLSGGILVGFINLWSPAGWGFGEGVVLFAAIIIGGAGSHKGAMVGALLVPLGFLEASRFLPEFGNPGLIPALQWVGIGLLILGFLWFRPQGIVPEPKRVFPGFPAEATAEATAADDNVIALPGAGSRGRLEVVPPQAAPGHLQPMDDEVVLRVSHLTRTFSGVAAVSDVSFDLLKGHLTGLIGPNGAGKSTTLAMVAGTLPATSGSVVLHDHDISQMPAYQRARHGLIRTFQLASEFKRLTVLENLLTGPTAARGDSFRDAILGRRRWAAAEEERIEKARALLDRFGLTKYANHYAGELSGGQRRLVEIMRALMAEPEVLLLDEPLAGVHPHLAREIGSQLLRLCKEGMTIMIVEHELSIMDEFCDPVIVMADGQKLAEGNMKSLRARPEVVEAYLVG